MSTTVPARTLLALIVSAAAIPTLLAGQLENLAASRSVQHEIDGSLSVGDALGRKGVIISTIKFNEKGKSRAEMKLGEVVKGETVEFSFDAAIDAVAATKNGMLMQIFGPPYNEPGIALRLIDGKYRISHGFEKEPFRVAKTADTVNQWHNWRFVIRNFGPDATFEVFLDGKSVMTGRGNVENSQTKHILRLGLNADRRRKGDAVAYFDNIRLDRGVVSPIATLAPAGDASPSRPGESSSAPR
jgi:hypothetical protein